jgi:hypothetical protein
MAYMVEAAMWAFKDFKRIGRVLLYAAFGNVMRWKLMLS